MRPSKVSIISKVRILPQTTQQHLCKKSFFNWLLERYMVPFLNMVMLAERLTCSVMDGAIEERQELHIEGSLPHSTLTLQEIASLPSGLYRRQRQYYRRQRICCQLVDGKVCRQRLNRQRILCRQLFIGQTTKILSSAKLQFTVCQKITDSKVCIFCC